MDTPHSESHGTTRRRRTARAILKVIAASLDSVIRAGEIGTRLRFPRSR